MDSKAVSTMQISKISNNLNSSRLALSSLALSMLLASMGVSIPNVALPTIAHEFGATFSEVQWIILIYLLAITALIVTAGRIGDTFGRKRVLLVGIVLGTIGALLSALAPALSVLIFARAVQGLGSAVLMALTVAFVGEAVPKEKTGSAMGFLGTMSAVGTAAGPSLGGVLIAGLGWQAIFLFMAILGLLNFYLSNRYLPTTGRKENTNDRRFDALGMVLMGAALTAYAMATTVGEGALSWITLGLLSVALMAGVLFIRTEKKAASPLIRLDLFRDQLFSANLGMNVIVATVMMSTLVVGPFYLSKVLGLNPSIVGMVMSVGPILSMLTGLPAGKIVDRFGVRLATIIGLVEMSLGLVALIVLPSMLGMVGYMISSAILSPGYQLFQAANNTSVMTNVVSSERGVISGMLSLSRNLGLITGASVMGAIFSFGAKVQNISGASPEAVAHGMRFTFIVSTGLILTALFTAVKNKGKHA